MPTIIENTQQVNALNEIEAALAIIKSINTIISAGDGTLAIVYNRRRAARFRWTCRMLPAPKQSGF